MSLRSMVWGLLGTVLCLGSAGASVSKDESDAAPATSMVMQQGDPLVQAGAGVPGDIRLEHGALLYVISQRSGALVEVAQLYPQRRLGPRALSPVLLDGAGPGHVRRPVFTKAEAQRTGDTALAVLEGYDSDDPQLQVRTRYEVGGPKGQDALRVTTLVRNTGSQPARVQIGDEIRWGSLLRYAPGVGFGPLPPGSPGRFLLGLGESGALLYRPAAGPGAATLTEPSFDVTVVRGAAAELKPGAEARLVRQVQLLRDLLRALCVAPSAQEAPLGGGPILRGTIKEDGSGAGVRGRVVLLRPDGQAAGVGVSAADGSFSLCAPAGAYQVRVVVAGREGLTLPTVQLPSSKDLALGVTRPGRLRVALREAPVGHHTPRPAAGLIYLHRRGGALLAAQVAAGVPMTAVGTGLVLQSPASEVEVTLPPGEYVVAGGRGPFYERTEEPVVVKAGETARVGLPLKRALPDALARGISCARLRADSSEPMDSRAAEARAADLDLLLGEVRGRAGDVAVVRGKEVLAGGRRIQVYPLQDGSRLPDLRVTPTLPGILDNLSQVAGEGGLPPLLQLAQGDRPSVALRASALEIWSTPAVDGVTERLSAWLQRGATGTAVSGAEPGLGELGEARGMPRTCAVLDGPKPVGIKLRDAIQRGEVVVTNGPWVRLQVNGVGLGGIAAARDGKLSIKAAVWAAGWVDASELEVLVGGESVRRVPIPRSSAALRYEGQLSLPIARDATVVVVVKGERPMGETGVRPLLFSGPIYVDRDGDGKFAPQAQ